MPASTRLHPSAVARRSVRALRALARPQDAAEARRYFKESDVLTPLGVRAPALRGLARELGAETRGVWSMPEALAFADGMVRSRYHEAKVLGLLVLARHHRAFDRQVLTRSRRWLQEGLLANWAAVDALCGEVVARVLLRHPRLIPTVAGWAGSRNRWLRRAAAVSLVPVARRGMGLEAAYEVAERLGGDQEDLVQKACGWLLREAGVTDRRRLETFLLRLGPRLSRTTVRYAIEHFPEARRRRMLRETRGRAMGGRTV